MGKLRDWWPAEEAVDQSRLSPCNSTASSPATNSSACAETGSSAAQLAPSAQGFASAAASSAALTLRLSDVTAALNAMPAHPPASPAPLDAACHGAPSSSSPPFSKPAVIRLASTQAHKDELLKKLLSKSESSTDLRMCLSQKPPPRPSASLPSSPVHANGNPVQMHASPAHTPKAPQLRRSFTAIMERGMQKKSESSEPTSNAVLGDDSHDLRKRKRDGFVTVKSSCSAISQDTEDNILTPLTPAATPELPGIQKEALTRREIHIFSERQRRKGMTHLYTILHSLLPDAKPKTDRCTVLTEAMEYIHELQSKLSELARQKGEILEAISEQLQIDASPSMGAHVPGGDNELGRHVGNIDDLITEEMREEILAAADVVVRFCGRDAFITLNSPRRSGVWSAILHVLHEQEMDLLNVTLSTSNDMDYHCIHAKVSNSELRSNELQKMLQEVVLNHAILD